LFLQSLDAFLEEAVGFSEAHKLLVDLVDALVHFALLAAVEFEGTLLDTGEDVGRDQVVIVGLVGLDD